MPTYTFILIRSDGSARSVDDVALDHDGATFLRAGQLLAEDPSGDFVEVWEGERPVLGRYRVQPVIRPVRAAACPKSTPTAIGRQEATSGQSGPTGAVARETIKLPPGRFKSATAASDRPVRPPPGSRSPRSRASP